MTDENPDPSSQRAEPGEGPARPEPTKIDRRAMFGRVAALGLQTLVLAATGAGLAKEARADLDCGQFNPETGYPTWDANCATVIPGDPPLLHNPDRDCAMIYDQYGNRYSDSHCSMDPWPSSFDSDCGGQVGMSENSGAYFQSDGNCGGGPSPGENDEDCGLPANSQGTIFHTDNNPGV